jgi:hypothetical protein
MPGNILTTASNITCTHGGRAKLTTSNTKIFADGALALLEKDEHPVMRCPFTVGSKSSPCVRIKWSAGASQVTVNGTPVLVMSSVGQCINAEGAIQGVAIKSTQMEASAR